MRFQTRVKTLKDALARLQGNRTGELVTVVGVAIAAAGFVEKQRKTLPDARLEYNVKLRWMRTRCAQHIQYKFNVCPVDANRRRLGNHESEKV